MAPAASASFEEAGRPPPGLRLQEKAPGQDPRWGSPTGAGEVSWVKGSGRDEHVQPAGDWREQLIFTNHLDAKVGNEQLLTVEVKAGRSQRCILYTYQLWIQYWFDLNL